MMTRRMVLLAGGPVGVAVSPSARGPVVVGLLKEHMKGPDPEIARRAEKCIERIKEKDLPADVPAAAARLLADRKPAGAAAALLAYLPFADNEAAAEEARGALA